MNVFYKFRSPVKHFHVLSPAKVPGCITQLINLSFLATVLIAFVAAFKKPVDCFQRPGVGLCPRCGQFSAYAPPVSFHAKSRMESVHSKTYNHRFSLENGGCSCGSTWWFLLVNSYRTCGCCIRMRFFSGKVPGG